MKRGRGRDPVVDLAEVLHGMAMLSQPKPPLRRRHWPGSWWDRLLLPPRKIRPMGLVAVQMSINPFEFYLLLTVLIVGVLYLLGIPPPSSVSRTLPQWAVNLWAVNLAVGGVAAFCGGLSRSRLDRGLAAYQFGWGLIGLATFVYGTAVFLVFQEVGLYTGVSNVLASLACLTRVIQVQRFFNLAERLQLSQVNTPIGGLRSLLRPPPDGE